MGYIYIYWLLGKRVRWWRVLVAWVEPRTTWQT
jgi:hypothetical protein